MGLELYFTILLPGFSASCFSGQLFTRPGFSKMDTVQKNSFESLHFLQTFLSIKPAHWAKVTILPWEKVLNVLKVAGFFRKGISAAIRRKAIRSAQLNLRKKWTVAPLALRFGR